MLYVLKNHYTDLTYMGSTGSGGPMRADIQTTSIRRNSIKMAEILANYGKRIEVRTHIVCMKVLDMQGRIRKFQFVSNCALTSGA